MWQEKQKEIGCVHPNGCIRCNWCGFVDLRREYDRLRRRTIEEVKERAGFNGQWIKQPNRLFNNDLIIAFTQSSVLMEQEEDPTTSVYPLTDLPTETLIYLTEVETK